MPLLEKWTPLPLDVMDRRMRRFFEDLGFAPALTPAADVYETDRELVVGAVRAPLRAACCGRQRARDG
jgi:HSP20 family molecular chaperone IbpA